MIRPRTGLALFAEAAAVAAVTGVAYGMLSHRPDYLGHYLAGLGGTLLLLSVPLVVLDRPRWTAAAVVLAAIATGYLTEATLFRLAIFDPVDFFNQSMGACLAGLLAVGRPRSLTAGLAAFTLGAALLAAGVVFAFA